ncbi:2OG-Fe(II) oxygenase [Laspinema sp. D1]|uniref:2OG-Fe(II) oxygenase n=1 Tax=Laspinema palackyanum TaxID=3231601 RepID=UPI00347BDCDB|nr:2OG-Fe(II) oxygenase [Laspinema sp. D2b]
MTIAQLYLKNQQRSTVTTVGNPTPGPKLCRKADSVTMNGIRDLVAGEILAQVIPNYFPPSQCQKVAQRLIDNPLFGYYKNSGAENVGRVGTAYFEIENDSYRRELYYAQAIHDIQALREMFRPHWSPIDQLRLDLEEIWPGGANLENIEGWLMFVGLGRVMENNAGILPHQDILRRDAPPNCQRASELKTQLAANIYLQTSQGGELEIWRRKVTDQEYEALRIPGSYGLDRMRLGPPDLTIKPEMGDLILFDSTNIHAVAPANAGVRVTISCFIGYRGDEKPLSFWS